MRQLLARQTTVTRNGRTRIPTEDPTDRPTTADTTDTLSMPRTDTADIDAPLVPLITTGTEPEPTDFDRLRREIDTIRTQLDRIEATIADRGDH